MKIKAVLKKLAAVLALSAIFGGIAVSAIPSEYLAKAQTQDTIDVWLIGGQSNAVGYAEDAPSDSDSRFTDGFDNVLYYGTYETDTNSCPTDFVPVKLGQGKNWKDGRTGSGAEIGIASALKDSGTMNAVIKCAWGATFLYPDTDATVSQNHGTWTSPSYQESSGKTGIMIGKMYTDFLDTVSTGLEKLESLGYTPIIKGMWWMQGEAECTNAQHANAYADCLTALIKDLRSDLSEMTSTDLSAMPFVLGKIFRNPTYTQYAYISTVREKQQEVADSMYNVFAVDCTDLEQKDGWHFKADAQKYLGETFVGTVLMGDQLRQICLSGANVTILGGGIKATGAAVDITFVPARGYKITSVTYRENDGAETTINLTNNKYAFTMPDASVFFTVSTEPLPLYHVTETNINDTAKGSVYLSGEVKNGWYEGESVEFAVVPAKDCYIVRITANGNELTCKSQNGNTFVYEIDNAADVVLSVEFGVQGSQNSSSETSSSQSTDNNTSCKAIVSMDSTFALLGMGSIMLLIKRRKK